MIATEFEYHRPDTVQEAVELFGRLSTEGKKPIYYGGGTEIITDARLGKVEPDAVIDLKTIPECRVLDRRDGELVIGCGLTLAEVCEAAPWALLTAAAGRVGDHTTRCKITLGGNLAGKLPYREAVLPLLLADSSHAVIAGPQGLRRARFADVFDRTLHLNPQEFLAQVTVSEGELGWPFVCVKKTRLDWVDYPLFTLAAIQVDRQVHVACSGLVAYPFRSGAMDRALNERTTPLAERVEAAAHLVPAPVVSDIHGTDAYRLFVFKRTLADTVAKLGG